MTQSEKLSDIVALGKCKVNGTQKPNIAFVLLLQNLSQGQ